MICQESQNVARQAEVIYEQKLKDQLEAAYPNKFVAIEPVSGDFFLGQTLSEAVRAARNTHPNRLSHVLRVGHRAALHFGVILR